MTVKITITIQENLGKTRAKVTGELHGETTANEVVHSTAMAEVITLMAAEINEGKHRKKPFSSFMKDCINGCHGLH